MFMLRLKCLNVAGLACLLMAARVAAGADLADIDIGVPGMPIHVSRKLQSMQELRVAHVQLQERDFSCGAASMTTIFNYYLDSPVSELEVIQSLIQLARERGTLQNIIERRGFTLLDLKKYAESKGFTTSAFKLEYDDLVNLGEPALVPVIPYGYKHFVVFRGADDKFVYLADPSFGNYTQPVADFKKDWYGFTNVALVVHRKQPYDKDHVPPLLVSRQERFDPQGSIDSFLHTDPPREPVVTTEW